MRWLLALLLALPTLAHAAELLPDVKVPIDTPLNVPINELRRAINKNFLLNDGSNPALPYNLLANTLTTSTAATGTITVPTDPYLAAALNKIVITSNDMNSAGAPGGQQAVAAFSVENNVGGLAFDGNAVSALTALNVSSPLSATWDGFITAGWQYLYVNVPAGANKGALTGNNPQVVLADSGTGPWKLIQGEEVDIANRGAVNSVIGLSVTKTNADLHQGILKDSAINIGSAGTGWKRGIDFSNLNGATFLDPAATMIFSEAITVAKGIDFSNVTFTDKAFHWNQSYLGGAGNAVLVSTTGNPTAQFFSTGANESQIVIDNQAGSQIDSIYFKDASTGKFWLSKTAGNAFIIYDLTHNATNFLVDASGNVTLDTAGGGAVRLNGGGSTALTVTGPNVAIAGTLSATNAALTTPTITSGATLGSGTLTGVPVPVNPTDAVSKTYADSIASGNPTHPAVVAASTANLTVTHAGAGVGATLTNNGTLAALVLDGVTINNGDRVLIKDLTTTQWNGLFTQTTAGTGAVAWILTRATDFDQASAAEVSAGAQVAVLGGTQATKLFIQDAAGPYTVDTTPLHFSPITATSTGINNNCAVANSLAYYAGVGTTISCLTMAANGVAVTSGSNVPSISSILPAAVQANITTVGTVATGTWTATAIGVSKGGTGGSLAATGGANNVVQQASVGANFSVGQLGFSALSGAATQAQMPTYAHTQSTVAAPALTASLTGVMMGLAGTITPTASGKVRISVCGDVKNATAGDGVNVQLRTGTGAAPVNGAALTGTTRGSLSKFTSTGGVPKARTCLIWTAALTLSVANWIDVGLASTTAGNSTISDVDIVADEIP